MEERLQNMVAKSMQCALLGGIAIGGGFACVITGVNPVLLFVIGGGIACAGAAWASVRIRKIVVDAEEEKFSKEVEHRQQLKDSILLIRHYEILLEYVASFNAINDNNTSIEDLKEFNHYPVEQKDGKWLLYRKVCYYGGCNFDPEEFSSEREAVKAGAVLSMATDLKQKQHKLQTSSTILADVNYACKDYHECSGCDD